jgi:hypothetical protein
MSIVPSDLALHGEIDRFWQSVDQRTESAPAPDEAHTDTPLFAWGVLGTALTLPQPHYRIFVPSPFYVVGWGLVANAAGNAVVKVERGIINQPASPPRWTSIASNAVALTSITGGADPTLAGQQGVITRQLSTWSVRSWAAFDVLHIYIASTSGLEELTFQLFTRRMRRVGTQAGVVTSGGAPVVTSGGAPVVA